MAALKIPVTELDHVQGSPEALVTLVEYGDYECPHCRHAAPIVKQLQQHFGEQLRFVFRNFPMKEVHPYAEPAAEAAEFAGVQGRFWDMHDGIYDNQPAIGLSMLFDLAESLELPVAEMRRALESRQFEPRVREDFRGGIRSGVNGTPTFFINGDRHDGPFEFDDLAGAIADRIGPESR